MLRKLIKYEFQATARYFLPMYLLLLVFAGLTHLLISVSFSVNDTLRTFMVEIPSAVMSFAYVAGLVGVSVITVLLIVARFYKNLLGNEGYLSFTLPVTPMQHVWGKLIPALVWGIAGCTVMILSIVILAMDANTIPYFAQIFGSLGEAMVREAPHSWILFLLLLPLLIVGFLHAYLEIYAAIVVGCQVKKLRILAGFGAYVGFSMVEQLLMSIGLTALVMLPDFPANVYNLFRYMQTAEDAAYMVLEVMVGCLLLMNIVFAAAYYIVVWQLLRKRLNLE